MSEKPISALRRRMIEDMSVRNFVEKTRNDYIRHVRTFTAFLGRAPDTATPEGLRRFQLHQTQTGVRPPSINGSVAALRFFFTVTLDRPEMAQHLTFVLFRLVGVPCIAAFRRVKSLLCHHSDRPKLANRSAGYFAGATSLTGVFSASVFSPCLFVAFRSRAMRPARRSCTTCVSSAFF